MEVVTWLVFMGWMIVCLVQSWAPIMFFSLIFGISMCCIAHAIRDLRSPWYDIKDYLNKRKEDK